MSDEPARDSAAPAVTPSGIWEHYCEHAGCKEWGSYGYQIGKRMPHWFCKEHRDDGERVIGRS
ncbi:hypothetical protein [Synechococcus phage Ssp-JY39]|nr:EsV-1-7 cysteine-rich motif protein [Synechococcus phage Yong-M2-251]